MRHPLADTPPASARRFRGVLMRAIVVLGVGIGSGVGALAVAGPAAAHDALVGSDPAAGSALTEAPTQVVLTFGAAQAGVGSEVVVTGTDGRAWSDGPAQVADATVTQPLTAPLPDGAYTVTWRSVAGDGHPVTGTFAFTVAVPAAQPTSTPRAGATATVPPTEAAVPPSAPSAPAAQTAAPALPETGDAGGPPGWAWPVGLAVGALVILSAFAVRRRRVSHD